MRPLFQCQQSRIGVGKEVKRYSISRHVGSPYAQTAVKISTFNTDKHMRLCIHAHTANLCKPICSVCVNVCACVFVIPTYIYIYFNASM
ncbi:hypothetical protein GDO86_007015 [Hymenochirus boettgeri]|uniref:Uncharacterized protein n=1 Tax=Hymenochirus boettgeri TaxID=247094 RepID=A0A8T2JD43_9PIPI|nr:hypothetical protein GDO86_007015 [Hymenochirus boettgeri]